MLTTVSAGVSNRLALPVGISANTSYAAHVVRRCGPAGVASTARCPWMPCSLGRDAQDGYRTAHAAARSRPATSSTKDQLLRKAARAQSAASTCKSRLSNLFAVYGTASMPPVIRSSVLIRLHGGVMRGGHVARR